MTQYMIYTVETGDTDHEDQLGMSGFIGWARLSRLLEMSECNPNEVLKQIVVTENGLGLRFGYERKEDQT